MLFSHNCFGVSGCVNNHIVELMTTDSIKWMSWFDPHNRRDSSSERWPEKRMIGMIECLFHGSLQSSHCYIYMYIITTKRSDYEIWLPHFDWFKIGNTSMQPPSWASWCCCFATANEEILARKSISWQNRRPDIITNPSLEWSGLACNSTFSFDNSYYTQDWKFTL